MSIEFKSVSVVENEFHFDWGWHLLSFAQTSEFFDVKFNIGLSDILALIIFQDDGDFLNFGFDEELLLRIDILFPLFGLNVVELSKRLASEGAVQKLSD